MSKILMCLVALSLLMHIGSAAIIKRGSGWACEWDCSSYSSCTHQNTLDPFKGLFDIFGIGRKKRGVCPPYPFDCDCSSFRWLMIDRITQTVFSLPCKNFSLIQIDFNIVIGWFFWQNSDLLSIRRKVRVNVGMDLTLPRYLSKKYDRYWLESELNRDSFPGIISDDLWPYWKWSILMSVLLSE